MNRDIVFRGKRVDLKNGKVVWGDWVEGYYYNQNTPLRINGEYVNCPYILVYDSHASIPGLGNCGAPRFYMVDPATVGQFTGLVDKNGVRIFEGDIVRDDRLEYRLLSDTKKGEKRRGIAAVRFGQHEVPSDDPFCWGNAYGFYFDGDTLRPTPAQYKPYDEYADGTFEVIGNIHDHPSLLQG